MYDRGDRMAYYQILYHTDGALAVVTLNRPRFRNAISRTMTHEIDAAFNAAVEDASVRVIVLRAEGDHFSSGHDLGSKEHIADLEANPYSKHPEGDYKKWLDLDTEMCLKWRQLPKPIVCGIKGYTIYHACAVMSCCDIILAADDAKIMPSLVEYVHHAATP